MPIDLRDHLDHSSVDSLQCWPEADCALLQILEVPCAPGLDPGLSCHVVVIVARCSTTLLHKLANHDSRFEGGDGVLNWGEVESQGISDFKTSMTCSHAACGRLCPNVSVPCRNLDMVFCTASVSLPYRRTCGTVSSSCTCFGSLQTVRAFSAGLCQLEALPQAPSRCCSNAVNASSSYKPCMMLDANAYHIALPRESPFKKRRPGSACITTCM